MGGRHTPRRGRRILGTEERRLWNRVAATALPLAGRDGRRDAAADVPDLPDLSDIETGIETGADPAATARPGAAPRAPNLPRTLPTGVPRDRPGAPSVSLRLHGPEVGPVGRPEAGLDRRTAERLRKGTREPDARIDLHGMTADRAHRACLRFLAEAMGRGARVVLVITGKGRARDDAGIMPEGRGVLRAQLPGWLKSSPLGHAIVGIYQAHQRHGGAGAFYVYLKRRR